MFVNRGCCEVLWNKKEVVPVVAPWKQEGGSLDKAGKQVTFKDEEGTSSACAVWLLN